jgi:pimeloyl-ACP methyl ester carboxylesterase
MACLLASVLASAPAFAQGATVASPSPPTAPAFAELPCTELQLEDLGDGITCGRLSVPESRAPDNTVTLSLPVVILRATGPDKADDPLLYLHGGPGLATVENAPRFVQSPTIAALRRTRDFVMFDQRGTGQSTPALCPDFDAELARIEKEAPSPTTATRRKRAAAIACREHLQATGRDRTAYTSSAIADDAEALRQALGYQPWNVLATSYGSFPAFELARRHPASVRAIVFNAPFPPNSPNRAEQLSTTLEGLAALQARCDQDQACAAAHPDLHQETASVIARLNAAPLDTANGRIDGYTFMGTVWNLLVRGRTAPLLPEYLKRAVSGDDAMLRKVGEPFAGAQSFGTLSFAQQWLVSCHDIYPRPSTAIVQGALEAHRNIAPDMDPTEQDTVCAELQPSHAPDSFYTDADLAVPALVYAGEYDPATPTSDATATMQLLANGTLVSVAGASHASMGTDECTLGIGQRFFEDPSAKPDLACLENRPKPGFPGPEAFEAFLESL